MYESNTQNASFYDLPFDDDESLITRQKYISYKLWYRRKVENSPIIDVYTNQI